MNVLLTEPQARTFYGVSYDTIFTVSTTIAVFALGYVFNRLYDNSRRKRELKDMKTFLIAYLRSLIEPIEKQITAFRTLSADVLSKKHQDFAYGGAIGSKLDIFDNLPQVDVFNAFLLGSKKGKQQRIAQFNSMLDALDYTKRQRDTALAQFKDFMASHTKYIGQWNTAVNAVVRYQEQLVSYAMRTNTQPPEDPFARDLNQLVHHWSQLEDQQDMDQVAEQVLEPIRQLCKRDPSDPRVHIVIPPILESLMATRNRNHLVSIFAKYLEAQATGLQMKKDALTDSIKCLEANH
jgi:hypothetical protein